MILLDTHVLLWLLEGSRRLSAKAWDTVDAARADDGALVSAITFWEVSMLADKRRLLLHKGLEDWVTDVLALPGVRPVPMDHRIAADAGSLPGDIHGDPADRIIAATARALDAPLLTVDEKLLAYAVAGHLHAEDARR